MPTPQTKLDALIAERTRLLRKEALELALKTLQALDALGFHCVYIIGSLATDTFMSHSDVDYWIEGELDSKSRAKIHATIERSMYRGGIDFDIVFQDDIRCDRWADFQAGKMNLSQVAAKISS